MLVSPYFAPNGPNAPCGPPTRTSQPDRSHEHAGGNGASFCTLPKRGSMASRSATVTKPLPGSGQENEARQETPWGMACSFGVHVRIGIWSPKIDFSLPFNFPLSQVRAPTPKRHTQITHRILASFGNGQVQLFGSMSKHVRPDFTQHLSVVILIDLNGHTLRSAGVHASRTFETCHN